MSGVKILRIGIWSRALQNHRILVPLGPWPGFAEFWDGGGKSAWFRDFVEWVEEQRSKAA